MTSLYQSLYNMHDVLLICISIRGSYKWIWFPLSRMINDILKLHNIQWHPPMISLLTNPWPYKRTRTFTSLQEVPIEYVWQLWHNNRRHLLLRNIVLSSWDLHNVLLVETNNVPDIVISRKDLWTLDRGRPPSKAEKLKYLLYTQWFAKLEEILFIITLHYYLHVNCHSFRWDNLWNVHPQTDSVELLIAFCRCSRAIWIASERKANFHAPLTRCI